MYINIYIFMFFHLYSLQKVRINLLLIILLYPLGLVPMLLSPLDIDSNDDVEELEIDDVAEDRTKFDHKDDRKLPAKLDNEMETINGEKNDNAEDSVKEDEANNEMNQKEDLSKSSTNKKELNKVSIVCLQRFKETSPFFFLYSSLPQNEKTLYNGFYKEFKNMNTAKSVIILQRKAISYVHKHKKDDTIFNKVANEINQLGKGNENQPYEFQRKNVISKIKEYNTSFAQVQHLVENRKKRKKHMTTSFNPLCKYTNTTNSMTILVLIEHDNVASHTVTIIDGLVFDSVLPHPLILSKESLDWCCNCEGGMKGIKYAVKITLSKQVQNKVITYEELKYKLKYALYISGKNPKILFKFSLFCCRCSSNGCDGRFIKSSNGSGVLLSAILISLYNSLHGPLCFTHSLITF